MFYTKKKTESSLAILDDKFQKFNQVVINLLMYV